MKNNLKQKLSCILFVALILGIAQESSGQVFVGRPAGQGMEKQMQKEFQMQLNQLRKRSENRLKVRLADIHSVCSLSDSQLKKLRVASRGAVAAATKKMAKSIQEIGKQINGGIELELDPSGAPPKEDEAKDEKEDAEGEVELAAGVQNGFAFGFDSMIGLSAEKSVEMETIWVKAFEKVLTAEQKSKYDAVIAKRKSFRRIAAVQSFIAKIDRLMLLTEEQRGKLNAIVDKDFGEKLERQVANSDNNGGVVVFGAMIDGSVKKDEPPVQEEMLSFLNADQMAVWKSKVAPELAALKMNGEVQLLNNWQPAGPILVEDVEINRAEDDDK